MSPLINRCDKINSVSNDGGIIEIQVPNTLIAQYKAADLSSVAGLSFPNQMQVKLRYEVPAIMVEDIASKIAVPKRVNAKETVSRKI